MVPNPARDGYRCQRDQGGVGGFPSEMTNKLSLTDKSRARTSPTEGMIHVNKELGGPFGSL